MLKRLRPPAPIHTSHSIRTSQVRGGFGHLGITVPDVYAACARFSKLGCGAE